MKPILWQFVWELNFWESQGWWFQIVFLFTTHIGEMIQFDKYVSHRLKPAPGKTVIIFDLEEWCIFSNHI